ncbi:MAG: PepSY-associated TM helix domain-containing protein [Janthinobacterium svalbardensis]|uniref:Peptidase n=1 Tax=Janthinobacterium svalbardensis TaxID=368607 RepID=A0A290WQH5_9BURK|nr:PepSY-associated TM helix domain-containing protein [Janthinobacterium svalbardensis]ATD59135.1 peptidase [Janthinobacterium svalbardensis]
MERTFGKSMVWLHSWAGVILGSVLFAIFWMGTLSVFDAEIDRWMMPQTRLAPATQPLSLDRIARAVLPAVPAGASQWRVDLPTPREPTLGFSYRLGKNSVAHQLDPAGHAFIPDQGTAGGSGFIFPFHYSLHLTWLDLGKWLVGLAAMAMLVLLVSGVVIHKKIVAQFFTFRPRKRLQRSALDLHNLSGLAALPFHFLITLSGLIIFITIYFPQAHEATYGRGEQAKSAFMAQAYGRFKRPKTGQPGTLTSIDAMARLAEREWHGGQPYFMRVWHPGDANSYVELRRSYTSDITMNLDQLYFDAGTGALLQRFQAAPVMTAQRVMSGLHFIRFNHWTLRWLYFLGGLSGCLLIATGYLFWLEGRRARHARQGLHGVRVVEGLAIGSVTGIMLATLAFFVANRLLPLDAAMAGMPRASLEMAAFYAVWVAAFLHAWLRAGHAWREQAWLIAAMALLAVLLNWLTTGDHPLHALAMGQHAVAGMDLLLLATAVLAAASARRLGRKAGKGSHA